MERRSLKKSRLQRDSNPWPPRLPVWCSINWAMKPHIGSEANLLSSYLEPFSFRSSKHTSVVVKPTKSDHYFAEQYKWRIFFGKEVIDYRLWHGWIWLNAVFLIFRLGFICFLFEILQKLFCYVDFILALCHFNAAIRCTG